MFLFFFFNDTATTEIYTLSLHDALPISPSGAWAAASPRRTATSTWSSSTRDGRRSPLSPTPSGTRSGTPDCAWTTRRSEEHTSELQSRQYLVCRLLLEKKKTKISN